MLTLTIGVCIAAVATASAVIGYIAGTKNERR